MGTYVLSYRFAVLMGLMGRIDSAMNMLKDHHLDWVKNRLDQTQMTSEEQRISKMVFHSLDACANELERTVEKLDKLKDESGAE